MARQHIITIGHYEFACKSMPLATQLLALLSKTETCEKEYESGYGRVWYQTSGEAPKLELALNQECRPKVKPLGLPKPKRGTVRCSCGHSDVRPGEDCPSCGSTYKP